MSILKKIMTAVRGGAREMGELVVDANGIRIFEQEIREAQTHLRKAKYDLTDVMAKAMQASRQIQSLHHEIDEHEGFVVRAIEQGDEALALSIAEKISRLETDLEEQREVQVTFSGQVERLRSLVSKTERQIREFERQLSMLKTTESVQKASNAIADNFAASSSKMHSARDSLARIKQRQQEKFDQMSAAETVQSETMDESLTDKLRSAGMIQDKTSAKQVLARIKAGQG
ncbi:PspA/IM30 family protein [Pseudomonadales bacterium]|nr:PspA/IM30 family protein [Pseudomonadales bacterium]MDA9298651.1 PspA/IM30 family protein [Pseudomonadales bacterium]MDB4069241.1 PspA/IM30 family protein [Pseudomonadales bacterium]MDB9868511.1 PspA/IM30 family protein [Pseudomonadales bacterium]MDB9880417.1 PspA/IM30 family protein [Pseudomonadales bacterium]